MKYTLPELNELIQEYLLTLDDEDRDEWYTTDRKFADGELTKFYSWLWDREEKENV